MIHLNGVRRGLWVHANLSDMEDLAPQVEDVYGDRLSGRTMSLAEAVRSALEQTLAGIEEPSPKARQLSAGGDARENVREAVVPFVGHSSSLPIEGLPLMVLDADHSFGRAEDFMVGIGNDVFPLRFARLGIPRVAAELNGSKD
jgi:hypothetical protein